jgi:hypothetical protein
VQRQGWKIRNINKTHIIYILSLFVQFILRNVQANKGSLGGGGYEKGWSPSTHNTVLAQFDKRLRLFTGNDPLCDVLRQVILTRR